MGEEGRRSSQQKKGSVGAKSLFSFLFFCCFYHLDGSVRKKQNKTKKIRKPEAPR